MEELTIDQWFAREDEAVQAIFTAMPKRRKFRKPAKVQAAAAVDPKPTTAIVAAPEQPTSNPFLRMRCRFLQQDMQRTMDELQKFLNDQFPGYKEK